MSIKSFSEDGGACHRQWHRTRRKHLLQLTGELPKNLCQDEITLTICCRYAESLLKNPRVTKYLAREHPNELRNLEQLFADFETACRAENGPGVSTPDREIPFPGGREASARDEAATVKGGTISCRALL
jgi:hypothetical protein